MKLKATSATPKKLPTENPKSGSLGNLPRPHHPFAKQKAPQYSSRPPHCTATNVTTLDTTGTPHHPRQRPRPPAPPPPGSPEEGTPRPHHYQRSTEWLHCEQYWWTTVLFLNDLYPDRPRMCVGWSWYLPAAPPRYSLRGNPRG